MRLLLIAACSLAAAASIAAADARLIAFDQPAAAKQIQPSDPAQVQTAIVGKGAKRALQVTCKAGTTGYPGVTIDAPGDAWDLSATGHVEAQVRNAGTQAIDVTLRIDNAGDWKANPWNAEHLGLKPGESRSVRVRYGFSFGKEGYALDPKRVVQALVFVNGGSAEQVFVIESLEAGGKPGEKP